jgi:hypothetical protein
MARPRLLLHTALFGFALLVACSGTDRSSGFADGTDPNAPNTGGGTLGGGGDGGTGAPCIPNSANYDIPGNNCDDDGDGKVDNPPTCDGSLAQTGTAADFARAMGICTDASKDGYGLVSATYTRGYNRNDAPKDQQHGVLSKFGAVIKPREGARLGVLSTGYAQEFDGSGNAPFGGVTSGGQLNGKDWWTAFPGSGNGTAPPGFPKPAAGCPIDNSVNDVIDLKLQLKAPPNVSGVKFDFNFYSGEWPAYICSRFNDGFVAYLDAKGFNGGKADNMSFDKNNNPVSVNNGFFDRCTPNVTTGCAGATTSTSSCPGGTSELAGTGFGITDQWCKAFPGGGNDASTNGGATGWLTSQAPVQAGETFTLEFIIWDTGDGILDSSVLLDNFTWAQGEVTASTDRPR